MGRRALIRPLVVIVLFLSLLVVRTPPVAVAGDEIEEALADQIGRLVAVPAPGDASKRDRAYRQFLQAVYADDPMARDRAVASYRRLDLPESHAFLGSLTILEARDISRRGLMHSVINVLTERRLVLDGITQLDAAVVSHPDNVDIRVVRTITYFQMPSIFGKFKTGFDDMVLLLEWMEKGQVTIPAQDPLFRDQASLYYYAGRYFLETGQTDQAREMFIRSSQASPRSPFAHASRQRQRVMDGRPPS